MEEIWKDIEGYEGRYQVSNLGRIKSFLHVGVRKDVEILDDYSHIIKPVHDACGYCNVRLRRNDKGKTVKVHRLVAIAFIPNPNNLPEINHKDEDKDNNCVSNLEWCDRIYNMQYGKNTRWHCMPVAQYTLDGRFVKRYNSIKEASNVTGIHSTNISNCAHKRIVNKEKGYIVKSAGGFKWEFISELGLKAQKGEEV